jgi:hypothetical protein
MIVAAEISRTVAGDTLFLHTRDGLNGLQEFAAQSLDAAERLVGRAHAVLVSESDRPDRSIPIGSMRASLRRTLSPGQPLTSKRCGRCVAGPTGSPLGMNLAS